MAKVDFDGLARGNSFSQANNDKPPEKAVTKVVTGAVTLKKKPLLMRLFGDSFQSIGSYLLFEVLIPAAQDVITSGVSDAIEMLIYGNDENRRFGRGSRSVRRRGETHVSYSSMYDRPVTRRRSTGESITRTVGRHVFDDVVFGSRGDADLVLTKLLELIDVYGIATVADFYSAVGLDVDLQDHNWGWETLARAIPRRVRDGVVLDMPRPIPLD